MCDASKCYDPLKVKRGFNQLPQISFANIVDVKRVTINTLLNETDCNLALNEGIMSQASSLSLKCNQMLFKFICQRKHIEDI